MRLNLCFLALFAVLGSAPHVVCQVDLQFLPEVTDYGKIYATAIQADGKILVAGEMRLIGNVSAKPLMRLHADGSLDNSFITPVLPKNTIIRTIAFDKDGMIMIGGAESSTPIAMRLLPDGAKDPSFTLPAQINQPIIKIVPLSDGSYLISSFSFKSLVKVKNNGTLDSSFDIGVSPNGISVHCDIVVQADGKIIFADAFSTFNNVPVNRIVRLNTNGSIDNSFLIGSGPENNSNPVSIRSIALDGDKIILVGSFVSFNSVAAKNIVRLLPSGAVDQSFVYPSPSANYFTSSIDRVALHNGGIVLAGLKIDSEVNYSLMKLKSDGSLESSFAVTLGLVSVNAGVIDAPVLTVSGSAILFSGYFDKIGSVARTGIALLGEDGLLDPVFDPLLGGNAIVKTSRVQADGKVIIGGTFNHIGGSYINNFARLNADGSVDESFRMNLGTGFNRTVNSIEILADGKILVGGTFDKFNGISKSLLIRLNADGTIDNTFSPTLFVKYVGIGVNSMLVLPSGKILVGGGFDYPSYTAYNLVMLQGDGTIDATFNDQILPRDQHVQTIARQSDNNLLIGGVQFLSSGGFMVRTTIDGVVINSFGTLDLSTHAVNVIKVLANDDFLMAGHLSSSLSSSTPNPLFQFNKDGNLVDKLSVAVYDGEILDIQTLDSEYVLLAGTFQRINSFPIKRFAKVKLNGAVTTLFDYSVDGVLFDLVKDNLSHNSFYMMGSFISVEQQPSFNLVKINLDMPKAPSNLSYTIDNTNGVITLDWQDKSYNETGFHILRSEGAGFIAIDSVVENGKTFIDLTALPLKTYTYKVGSFTTLFQSTFSNEISVSTSEWVPPIAPTGLTFDISDDFESAILNWTDASNNEKGFEVERSLNGAAFTFLNELQSNVVTYSDGVVIDALHRYRLRAFNKFGISNYTEIVELPVITSLEEESILRVTAYPNPTSDKVWISAKSDAPLCVMVFDLQGKLHRQQMSTDQTIEVSLSNMTKGLYIFKVLSRSRYSMFKIEKR